MISCLYSCAQSHDIAGDYEKISKDGSVEYLLELRANGTFLFDSYTIRQVEGKSIQIKGGMTTEPSIRGRGRWRAENDMVHFETDRNTDIDHNYPLNLHGTRAKYRGASDEKAIAEVEFVESEVFWITGIELVRKNPE